jgi:autotransporter-associated beta strand protein
LHSIEGFNLLPTSSFEILPQAEAIRANPHSPKKAMTIQSPLRSPRLRRTSNAILPVLLTACAPLAFAGNFIATDAGPYEYTTAANWGGSIISNSWGSSLTANQTITFNQDYTTVAPSSGTASISITNNSLFNHTFIGAGANRTLSLGGSISLASSSTNANKVTFGSLTDGQQLNIDLGSAARTFGTGTNRTLEILNVVSGAGSITQNGSGTLQLKGLNTFTGSVTMQTGSTLEVTKLADGGQASNIGAGSTSSARIVLSGGTLKYLGTGDSTNHKILIGSAGGIIDSSGGGSIKFTNTASVDVSPSSPAARTWTLTGTNTNDNTIAAAYGNSGSGANSITKSGSGRWILSGNNTYTGATTINAGTLELGSNTGGGNGSNMILNGGTFATGGFSETFGTLQLTANSVIDLGNNGAGSALAFAASNSETWTPSVSLSIINFTDGVDSVFFGVGGLTGAQLAQIRINGTNLATLDGSGFLAVGAAIPEPSTYASLAGLGCFLLAATRRRRAA